MSSKQRLSASIDADLLEAARTAVADGRISTVSAWVNEALQRQAEHDRRMRALDDFLATYEAEHGPITDDEIHAASRRARARALVARGSRRSSSRRRRPAGAP
ncbi:MAG: hypothetical protein ACRD2X_18990 [Vicinamibacteraceae bacterium]